MAITQTTGSRIKDIAKLEGVLKSQQKTLSGLGENTQSTGPTGEPTAAGLSAEVERLGQEKAVAKTEEEIARARWYGSGNEEGGVGKKDGLLMKGLKTLAAPTYMLAGATKYAIGKGKAGEDVFESMDRARMESEGFGGVLSSVGLPTLVSMPVGLAMDIILDPLDILTGVGPIAKLYNTAEQAAETAGVKLASGAGVKAAGTAMKAGAKATGYRWLDNLINAFGWRPGSKELGQKIALAMDDAQVLGKPFTNDDIAEVIKKFVVTKAEEGMKWKTLGVEDLAKMEDVVVDGVPKQFWEGLEVKKFGPAKDIFKVKGLTETQKATLAGSVGKLAKLRGEVSAKALGSADEFAKLTDWDNFLMNKIQARALNPYWVDTYVRDPLKTWKTGEKNTGEEVLKWLDYNPREWNRKALRTITEIPESEDIILPIVPETSGILKGFTEGKPYMMTPAEQLVEKLKGTVGKIKVHMTPKQIKFAENMWDKLSDFNDAYLGLFKTAKLGPLAPSSMVNAVFGNKLMAHLFGIDITRPDYAERIKDAIAFYAIKAKGSSAIAKALDDPSIYNFLSVEKNAILFEQTMGMDPMRMFRNFEEELGTLSEIDFADRKEFESALGMLQKKLASKYGIESEEIAGMVAKNLKEGYKSGGVHTGALASELENLSGFKKLVDFANEKAELGSLTAKAFKRYLDLQGTYGLIDKTDRLGTFVHLVQDGLTENELLKITGMFGQGFKIAPTDIIGKVRSGAKTYYKIAPVKALEMVNDIYMNYAAMPQLVQLLRKFPVLGQPFAAFSYAMMFKMGGQLLSNPAQFNKIMFALSELQQEKGELEKENLQSKYYEFYNKPGMVSLVGLSGIFPRLKNNPVYINLEPMIPYWSLNMFEPSSRSYTDKWPDQLANIVEKSPFFKDPVGQMIMDYFFMPAVLSEGQPQNQFGSPLYPVDASFSDKAGRALSELVGAVVPPIAGETAALVVPESALPYAPITYSGKKFGYAKLGKTSVGVPAKENATQRSLRAFLSSMGIALHPMNLSYLESQVKKGLNK